MKKLSVVVLTLAGLLVPAAARAELMFGLTSTGNLVSFDTATPGTLVSNVGITGLGPGETLIGIDFRPATGQLFGVSYNSNLGPGAASIYTINTVTGLASSANAFTVPVSSVAEIAIDFNPVPNGSALRIITSGIGASDNFRVGTGGTGTVFTDTTLTPGEPVPLGAAYSDNFPGGDAGRTTLYVIDGVTGNLFTQGSLNSTPRAPTPASCKTASLSAASPSAASRASTFPAPPALPMCPPAASCSHSIWALLRPLRWGASPG